MKKRLHPICAAVLLLAAALLLSACGGPFTGFGGGTVEAVEGAPDVRGEIVFSGGAAAVSGSGAKAEGTTATVASAGTYRVSGSCADGQLIVDTGDEAMDVTLLLDGLSLTNPAGPAVHIRQAKNVYIRLGEGKSVLTSGTEADLARWDGTQEGAVILSEDDLIFEGGPGELELRGYINNGVTCRDDLEITGCVLSVLAAGSGLRGSESVTVSGGMVAINAGNDGIRTSSAEKAGKGYVDLNGGSIAIRCGGDGVQAEADLRISGATLTVSAEGTAADRSSRALRAGTGIDISGGFLTLRSVEDAIRCTAGDVVFSGGTVAVSTPEDAVQAGERDGAEGSILISGGTLHASAGKRALHAFGQTKISGGTLLACTGSEQELPLSDGPLLLVRLQGKAGDEMSVDGTPLGFSPEYDYHCFLYVDSSLEAGKSYLLGYGERDLYVKAETAE